MLNLQVVIQTGSSLCRSPINHSLLSASCEDISIEGEDKKGCLCPRCEGSSVIGPSKAESGQSSPVYGETSRLDDICHSSRYHVIPSREMLMLLDGQSPLKGSVKSVEFVLDHKFTPNRFLFTSEPFELEKVTYFHPVDVLIIVWHFTHRLIS